MVKTCCPLGNESTEFWESFNRTGSINQAILIKTQSEKLWVAMGQIEYVNISLMTKGPVLGQAKSYLNRFCSILNNNKMLMSEINELNQETQIC